MKELYLMSIYLMPYLSFRAPIESMPCLKAKRGAKNCLAGDLNGLPNLSTFMQENKNCIYVSEVL